MTTLIYQPLHLISPRRRPPSDPRRIALVLPCCIGDVILATAALKALRRAYPRAHIAWYVGSWSRPAIADHDLLDEAIDTGPSALPVTTWAEIRAFADRLRAGQYDLAVSLVRSPRMSLAVRLSRIPFRAGIDSGGRGFGYNLRAHIDPGQPRHEAEIYLDVIRALGVDSAGCYANVPVRRAHAAKMRGLVGENTIVIHPGGGNNPGMVMDAKRWPPKHFAALADRLADALGSRIVLIGAPGDRLLVDAVAGAMTHEPLDYAGKFSLPETAALASIARLYIGNDTGLTHLAAAAGARTCMILGPSDPRRYAPFTPLSLALWQPVDLPSGGVSAGPPPGWDWARDGIGVDEAAARILAFVR
jgi:ADP-heptose:LPS heptosyltransferase